MLSMEVHLRFGGSKNGRLVSVSYLSEYQHQYLLDPVSRYSHKRWLDK